MDSNAFIYILQGIWVTLQYTVIALIAGNLLGAILAILRYNHIAVWAINSYISFIRGTPLLVQLTLIFFVLPNLIGLPVSVFVAGCIAFSINSSAYVTEIITSGINSVDKGQFEACKALHIPPYLMWKDIILPQAFRNILPALVNEAISIVKETALISTLGDQDIMRRAQMVAAEQYVYLQPLLTAAICYYFLTFCLERLAKQLEKGLRYDYHSKPV